MLKAKSKPTTYNRKRRKFDVLLPEVEEMVDLRKFGDTDMQGQEPTVKKIIPEVLTVYGPPEDKSE